MNDQNEKQAIEEMAKDVTRSISWCNEEIPCVDCLGTAASLYDKGYRKQSEGEWKKEYGKAPRYVCTACNHLYNNKGYKFCPNCGAKMKGGAGDDS